MAKNLKRSAHHNNGARPFLNAPNLFLALALQLIAIEVGKYC